MTIEGAATFGMPDSIDGWIRLVGSVNPWHRCMLHSVFWRLNDDASDKRYVPLEDLELPPRAHNALRRSGIWVVNDLIAKSVGEIVDLRWIGVGAFQELYLGMWQFGYHLVVVDEE